MLTFYSAPRTSGAAIAPPPALMDLDIPTPDFMLQKTGWLIFKAVYLWFSKSSGLVVVHNLMYLQWCVLNSVHHVQQAKVISYILQNLDAHW